jgi:hypothetical protein
MWLAPVESDALPRFASIWVEVVSSQAVEVYCEECADNALFRNVLHSCVLSACGRWAEFDGVGNWRAPSQLFEEIVLCLRRMLVVQRAGSGDWPPPVGAKSRHWSLRLPPRQVVSCLTIPTGTARSTSAPAVPCTPRPLGLTTMSVLPSSPVEEEGGDQALSAIGITPLPPSPLRPVKSEPLLKLPSEAEVSMRRSRDAVPLLPRPPPERFIRRALERNPVFHHLTTGGALDQLHPFQMQSMWSIGLGTGKVLLADEMGLGKTPQALTAARMFRDDWPVLCVVPSSLRWHWAEEIENWNTDLGPDDVFVAGSVRSLSGELSDVAASIFGTSATGAVALIEATRPSTRSRSPHARTSDDCALEDVSEWADSEGMRGDASLETRAPQFVVVSFTMLAIWSELVVAALETRGLVATGGQEGPFRLIGDALARRFGVILVDEAHFLRDMASSRSKAVVACARSIKRAVLLTGTPCLTKPAELFPMLQALRPDLSSLSSSFRDFARRYGGACWSVGQTKGRRYVQEFYQGSSCVRELHLVLRNLFMIRRRKNDVLGQLPPKVRQRVNLISSPEEIVLFEKRLVGEIKLLRELRGGVSALSAEEQRLLEGVPDPARLVTESKDDDEEAVLDEELDGDEPAWDGDEDPRVTRIDGWHATARLKASLVVSYVLEALRELCVDVEGGLNKVIVFGHHRCMLDQLEEALVSPPASTAKRSRRAKTDGLGWTPGSHYVRIDGSTEPSERARLVRVFHESAGCALALVSTRAGGMGLDLSPATTVLFAELDWVPGYLLQAEDRAYRLSRTDSRSVGPHSVLVRYLVCPGTTDDILWPRFVSKAGDIAAAIDDDRAGLQVHDGLPDSASLPAAASLPVHDRTPTAPRLQVGDEAPCSCPVAGGWIRFSVSRYTGFAHLYDKAGTHLGVRFAPRKFLARPSLPALTCTCGHAQCIVKRLLKSDASEGWAAPKACTCWEPAAAAFACEWSLLRATFQDRLCELPPLPLPFDGVIAAFSTSGSLQEARRVLQAHLESGCDSAALAAPAPPSFERNRPTFTGAVALSCVARSAIPCAQCHALVPTSALVHLSVTTRPLREPTKRPTVATFVLPYCSQQCRHDYASARASSSVRKVLGQLEHGVCQSCGIDARGIWRALASAGRSTLVAAQENLERCKRRAAAASALCQSRVAKRGRASAEGPPPKRSSPLAKASHELVVAEPREECGGVPSSSSTSFGPLSDLDETGDDDSTTLLNGIFFELHKAHNQHDKAISNALELRMAHLERCNWFPRKTVKGTTTLLKRPRLTEGMFWEADHIVPVAEGGGEASILNYRTLCVVCHREVTNALLKRLAQKRSHVGQGSLATAAADP